MSIKNIKIVIGSSLGDEGKGLMTDYFCNQAKNRNENCIVVCSNGGSQRGHTVSTPEGIHHVFHHFGSGTFVGADTYFSEKFIVNPMVFRQEYEELEKLGFKPKVYVNDKCLWTTPFDMIINQIAEENRGENRHGSCGQGVWETIVRSKEWYIHGNLNSTYVSNPIMLKTILETIRRVYVPFRLSKLGIEEIPEDWKNIINSPGLIKHYMEDMKFFLEHTEFAEDTILHSYSNVVFENGQGLLLDQNRKEYGDNTTPSNTGICNPLKVIYPIGLDCENTDVEVCYVTRTYLTRHGAGRFDEECDKTEINAEMEDLTNIPNPHQGSLRYGKLDYEKLHERIAADLMELYPFEKTAIKKSLAITHINEYPAGDYKNLFDGFCIYESDGMTRDSVKLVDTNQK